MVMMSTNTDNNEELTNATGTIMSSVNVSHNDVTIDATVNIVMGTNTLLLEEPTNMISNNITENSTEVVSGTNIEAYQEISVLIGGNIPTVNVMSEDMPMETSPKCKSGNVNENIDTSSSSNINALSSAVPKNELEIVTTKDDSQPITLTKLFKAVVQSINIVPSLKDCCHLSMSCHKSAFNLNTRSSNSHINIDHSYDFGYKHRPNEKSRNSDDAISDLIGLMDGPLMNNTMDSVEDINVVIDSMAVEVPVCVNNTLYNDQTDLSATSNDDQTHPLEMSDESLSPVKYDPIGTELILPLKKRKPIVQNP